MVINKMKAWNVLWSQRRQQKLANEVAIKEPILLLLSYILKIGEQYYNSKRVLIQKIHRIVEKFNTLS